MLGAEPKQEYLNKDQGPWYGVVVATIALSGATAKYS
jgi:hypothetical protein